MTVMQPDTPEEVRDWSTSRILRQGFWVLLLGFGGFLLWAIFTEIDGAVVTTGQVAVEERRQAVQHSDGGVVAALHVREGDVLAEGAPILTLDGTELRAQESVTRRALVETQARLDRLGAEVRGEKTVTYRAGLTEMAAADTAIAGVLRDETALFTARRETLDQTAAQLAERQVQTESIIAGREQQLTAARTQLDLIKAESSAQESLLERGLTEASRVSALQRESARLTGQVGEIEASIAEARSAIAGYKIEALRQESAFREAAQNEIRSLQPREAEFDERLRILTTKIDRLVLRAPMGGTVLGLQANTVGGIVPAGQQIAAIVPDSGDLIVQVEVDPRQIDRLHAGQEARIRFPNFNSRTTPELTGQLIRVSPDAMADQAGRRFFIAEIALPADAGAALGAGNVLTPGMPVDAFIRTDARTPMSFLLKPVADYMAYAMREE